MADKLIQRMLWIGAGGFVSIGILMVVIGIVYADSRMCWYGALSLLFSFSDALYAYSWNRRTGDFSWPVVSVEFDPVAYRDPVSGVRFLEATISTTILPSDTNARDALTSSYREYFRIDGLPERTKTIASVPNAQAPDVCAG